MAMRQSSPAMKPMSMSFNEDILSDRQSRSPSRRRSGNSSQGSGGGGGGSGRGGSAISSREGGAPLGFGMGRAASPAGRNMWHDASVPEEEEERVGEEKHGALKRGSEEKGFLATGQQTMSSTMQDGEEGAEKRMQAVATRPASFMRRDIKTHRITSPTHSPDASQERRQRDKSTSEKEKDRSEDVKTGEEVRQSGSYDENVNTNMTQLNAIPRKEVAGNTGGEGKTVPSPRTRKSRSPSLFRRDNDREREGDKSKESETGSRIAIRNASRSNTPQRKLNGSWQQAFFASDVKRVTFTQVFQASDALEILLTFFVKHQAEMDEEEVIDLHLLPYLLMNRTFFSLFPYIYIHINI